MFSAELRDRAILTLSGEDAIPFLQGLITNDATRIAQGESLYAALLSPQGKFLHDFFLIPQEGSILLDVRASRAADLIARLGMYKLRSKVSIELLPDMHVIAVWDSSSPMGGGISDPRLPALGWRSYGNMSADTNATLADYEAHRIALGVPDGAQDMHIDKSLPLEFRLDALHGVSFSKGCYVGQEVTARSKFRGQVRKQLYAVHSKNPLPASGTEITIGGSPVGELRSTSGQHGLALLRTEDLEKAAAPLMADGVELHWHVPGWCTS